MGRNNKLLPRQRGTYQVRGRNQSIYIIEDLVLGKQIKTHVDRIELAQQNEQEFMVRDIIAHRGDHQDFFKIFLDFSNRDWFFPLGF